MSMRQLVPFVIAASTIACRQAPTSQPTAIPTPIAAAPAAPPENPPDFNVLLLDQADRIRRFTGILDDPRKPIDNYDGELLAAIKAGDRAIRQGAPAKIADGLEIQSLHNAASECEQIARIIAGSVGDGGIGSFDDATKGKVKRAAAGEPTSALQQKRERRVEQIVGHATKADAFLKKFIELHKKRGGI